MFSYKRLVVKFIELICAFKYVVIRKKQCCEKHNAVSKQFTKNYSAKSAVRLQDANAFTHTNTVKAVYCKLLCKNNSPLTDPDDSRAGRFSSVRPATLKTRSLADDVAGIHGTRFAT